MTERRRFKQVTTLQDRIAEWAVALRAEAATMSPGPDRDTLLDKVRQAENAIRLDDWVSPNGG